MPDTGALAVTVADNPGEVVAGASVTVWANASGGTAPYTYLWTLPTGCTAGNVATFTCGPTQLGSVTFSVRVTDSASNRLTRGVGAWVDASAYGVAGLSVSPSAIAYPNPSTFFGFDYRCSPENTSACVSFVRAAGVHWFRVPGDMEGYNATSGVEYQHFGGTASVSWSWPDIKGLCAVISPCNVVPTLPAVPNDTGLAVGDVRYVEGNYSFIPAMWSPGNEPQGWVSLGHPLSTTPLSQPYDQVTTVNASEIGFIEARVDLAVQAFAPGARVFAIQSASCNAGNAGTTYVDYAAQWAVQKHVGNAPIVGCHAFPGAGATSVAGFLSPANIQSQETGIQAVQAPMAATCSGCQLPVWATEFAASTSAPGAWATGMPGAVLMAADAAQLLVGNVSQFETYYMGCGNGDSILTTTCAYTQLAYLYATVFAHLRVGAVHAVTPVSAPGGLYGVFTTNASGSSLLLVNTNTTVGTTIALPTYAANTAFTEYAGSASGWSTRSLGSADAGRGGIVEASGAPTSWYLAPMSVLLLNANSSAVPGSSSAPPGNGSSSGDCASLLCHLPSLSLPSVSGLSVAGGVLVVAAVLAVLFGRGSWKGLGILFGIAGFVLLVLGA